MELFVLYFRNMVLNLGSEVTFNPNVETFTISEINLSITKLIWNFFSDMHVTTKQGTEAKDEGH